jgi:hypothetical protein
LSGGARPGGLVAPGAETTTNVGDSRPRSVTRAGQDVEVKAASGTAGDGSAKDAKNSANKNKKDTKDNKDKNKKSGSSVLRNP